MGAGDARFSSGGHFSHYHGVEIDEDVARSAVLPKNATLQSICAFLHSGANYDACIGNPPYVRHHDIESPWKEEINLR